MVSYALQEFLELVNQRTNDLVNAHLISGPSTTNIYHVENMIKCLLTCGKCEKLNDYAPNFEKVGDILVSACPYVCMYVCMYVFMFEISS